MAGSTLWQGYETIGTCVHGGLKPVVIVCGQRAGKKKKRESPYDSSNRRDSDLSKDHAGKDATASRAVAASGITTTLSSSHGSCIDPDADQLPHLDGLLAMVYIKQLCPLT